MWTFTPGTGRTETVSGIGLAFGDYKATTGRPEQGKVPDMTWSFLDLW
jgi:hypothetical protein